MKLYTVDYSVSQGVSLTKDERLGPCLCLGELGRGREYKRIALDRLNPPETDGKKLMAAAIKYFTVNSKEYIVFEKEYKESDNVLVRICTQGAYVRGAVGFVRSDKVLARGTGAFGIAGRLGTFDDALALMAPGDVVEYKMTRDPMLYRLELKDGVLRIYNEEQWDIETAPRWP